LKKNQWLSLLKSFLSFKKLHNKTDIDTKKRAIRAIEIERYNIGAKEKHDQLPVENPLVAGVLFSRERRREKNHGKAEATFQGRHGRGK